jgi:glyoxylase-like metal-dependent hydrolase (beta-lactamase superfamily II)
VVYSKKTREAIAFDPGNDLEGFLKFCESLGVKLKALFHTHAHFDHIGCSYEVSQKFEIPLFLHPEDKFLYDALPTQGMWFGCQVPKPGPLKHFLEDGMELGINDLELAKIFNVLHTPGHTPGSVCFYSESFEKAPILLTGDTLFKQSIGRTDLPGGDFDRIKKSIKQRLFTLPEETCCLPGHGPETRIYEEKRKNPFF